MRILRNIAIAAAMPLTITAMALNVESNVAGQLSSRVSDTDITTLTVTGEIDASDFAFISDELTSLTSLDLSGATIVAYNGVRTLTGGTEYAANTVPAYGLFGLKASSVVLPSTVTVIGESALASSDITSIAIPASVTTIGSGAFAGCKALTSITIPASVTTVGDNLAMGCTALQTATVAADEIGARWFEGCTALTTVAVSDDLSAIGENAFAGCTALRTFGFPASLKYIGAKAFYQAGITKADLSAATGLKAIGDYAFADNSRLTEVKFRSSSAQLGKGVFFNDTKLAIVELPASTTVIPELTFANDNSLVSETMLPNSITTIGDYALTGWTQVTEFALPSSLSYLGDGAMEGWTRVSEIHGGNLKAVPALGKDVFEGIDQPNVELSVDPDLIPAFNAAAQWKEFKVKADMTDSSVDAEIDAAGSDIEFYFVGSALHIATGGTDIARIDIYDLNGRTYYTESIGAPAAVIEAGGWSGAVMIVSVTLADGSHTAIKITVK